MGPGARGQKNFCLSLEKLQVLANKKQTKTKKIKQTKNHLSFLLIFLSQDTGIKEEFSWEFFCLHPVTLDLESSHSQAFWYRWVVSKVIQYWLSNTVNKFSSPLLLKTLLHGIKCLQTYKGSQCFFAMVKVKFRGLVVKSGFLFRCFLWLSWRCPSGIASDKLVCAALYMS